MIKEPWFWRSTTLTARALTYSLMPAAVLYDAAQKARNNLTRATKVDKPVICIGNATLGGEGKTPFAILAAKILRDEGIKCQFLTRGYGGRLKGPVLVDEAIHRADDVGDEALLLSRIAPVWKSQDRVAGAKAAIKNGAEAIMMDDGYQNPTLEKGMSVLLYGGKKAIGNQRVFPAGPLREPVARAVRRANLIVRTQNNDENLQGFEERPVISAHLEPTNAPAPQKVVAFSGIGKPQRFFDLLETLGFDVAARLPFPDHYSFSVNDVTAIKKMAKEKNAAMITTEKDLVRLSEDMEEEILTLPVEMRVDNEPLLREALLKACGRA